jgi:hypothetical protein
LTFPVFEMRAVSVKFCASRTWPGDAKTWMVSGGVGDVVAAAALAGVPPLRKGIIARSNSGSKKRLRECAAPCPEGCNFVKKENRTYHIRLCFF